MKSFLISIMFINCLFTFSSVMAQKDSSGIYKTALDFQQRKLSYAINVKTQKHTIKDKMVFNGDQVKVKHEGQIYTMDKSATYGFRDMKGEEYRFVDKKEYRVLNPGETILLYTYQHVAHSPKEATQYPLMYFFCIDAASAPLPLTKANLKAAVSGNHKFHDALDLQFKSDEELHEYDTFHKIYKLNRIYGNSK